MGFIELGGEIQGSENLFPQMDWQRSFFPSWTGTDNTRLDNADLFISMDEEVIRKATCRFNAPLKCWGCTNSRRYYAGRFHTYRNCPNKRYPDVVERVKHSIQEYAQCTSMMGGIRGDQNRQGERGQTYPMALLSMFAEWRVQLSRSWKEEGFGSLDHTILMCEIMDPYTSRSVWLDPWRENTGDRTTKRIKYLIK